ncbi:MAG: glycosyltransferase family 4 protein [Patescibacteria group bacterium]
MDKAADVDEKKDDGQTEMKITFLTPNLEMHGGNLVMLRYANFLAESGHEVTIISADRQTLFDIDRRITLKQYKSFPIRYVDFFLLQKIYFKQIIGLISECDFLIPIYTPLLPAIIKAKKQKKLEAKIVFLFQDFFEMVWAGPFIKRMLGNKKITENIALAVCVSDSSEKALRSVSKVKSVVVKNGIDPEFHQSSLKRDNYLLFVGRPQRPKGFHIFKEAYRIIKRDSPEIKAKVVSPTVEDRIVNGIEFIKYKDREQLAEIYSRALIYVNTSLGESFGLPALEAMASGAPVVLTDTVGAREYAKNKENCIVTAVNRPEETTSAIKKILADSKLCKKLIDNGLETAGSYSWSKSFEKLIKLLKHLN